MWTDIPLILLEASGKNIRFIDSFFQGCLKFNFKNRDNQDQLFCLGISVISEKNTQI